MFQGKRSRISRRYRLKTRNKRSLACSRNHVRNFIDSHLRYDRRAGCKERRPSMEQLTLAGSRLRSRLHPRYGLLPCTSFAGSESPSLGEATLEQVELLENRFHAFRPSPFVNKEPEWMRNAWCCESLKVQLCFILEKRTGAATARIWSWEGLLDD